MLTGAFFPATYFCLNDSMCRRLKKTKSSLVFCCKIWTVSWMNSCVVEQSLKSTSFQHISREVPGIMFKLQERQCGWLNICCWVWCMIMMCSAVPTTVSLVSRCGCILAQEDQRWAKYGTCMVSSFIIKDVDKSGMKISRSSVSQMRHLSWVWQPGVLE